MMSIPIKGKSKPMNCLGHEFAMEFERERFENDETVGLVFGEFLSGLFDELGLSNMRISVYDNLQNQTKVFKVRWEE